MGDKKIAIIDSSSAILLYKAGIFDSAASAYEFTVTDSVVCELTRDEREGSDHFSRVINAGMLVNAGHAVVPEKNSSLLRLGTGERDSIVLFLSGYGSFIIIDDGKGARTCRDLDIPYINALLLARILHDSGYIENIMYETAFNTLLRVGRYSDAIITFVRDCEKEMLRNFYP